MSNRKPMEYFGESVVLPLDKNVWQHTRIDAVFCNFSVNVREITFILYVFLSFDLVAK